MGAWLVPQEPKVWEITRELDLGAGALEARLGPGLRPQGRQVP